jgi:hypothetical protein
MREKRSHEMAPFVGDCRPEPGATQFEIEIHVRTVFAPLSPAEIEILIDEHQRIVGDGCFDPRFDPTTWRFPSNALPDIYLEFLRFSNGGFFNGQHRKLDPLFSTHEARDYMLGYSVPHWMPMTLPFAFDGGGGFYLLDMRHDSVRTDFPVLWAHASNLGFDDAQVLAPSFMAFIEFGLGRE